MKRREWCFGKKGGLVALVVRLKAGEDPALLLPLLVAALWDGRSREAVQGDVGPLLLTLLRLPVTPATPLACTALSQLTECESARASLLSLPSPVLDALLPLLAASPPASLQAAVVTALANLAYTAGWKTKLRERAAELTPALTAALRRKEVELLSATFSLLANLCTQAASHSLLTSTSGLIPAFAVAVTRVFRAGGDARGRGQASAVAVLLNLSLNAGVFAETMEAVKPALPAMIAALSSTTAGRGGVHATVQPAGEGVRRRWVEEQRGGWRRSAMRPTRAAGRRGPRPPSAGEG